MPYVLSGDVMAEIRTFIERLLDPRRPSRNFIADIEIEDLDHYDDVRDFIFVPN